MSIPVTGAPAYNSSSLSLAGSSHTNTSSSTSSSVTNLSLSTSSGATSRSSISTGPSLIGSTSSSNSATSSLPSRHLSGDGSIIIESYATPSPIGLSHPLNTPILSEKWMSTSADWTALKDPHLFSISLFLSPEDVAHALVVCSVWKQSLDTQVVWKNQHQIQGYAPIHPDIETHLRGSDNSRFLPSVLTIIAEYEGEPRVFDYTAEFAKPIPNAIMPKDYAIHFCNVQVLNPIPRPSIMRKENNKPDPDQPGKTIGETHIWTYRPGNKLHINGNMTMLTMDILEQLVQHPLQGHLIKFAYVTPEISQEQRSAPIMGEEGWDLMTKTVCKGTKNIPFDRQQPIVTQKGYEIPSGPDIILTSLVWHVLTGEYLFGQDPMTYTRTNTLTASGVWRWVIGDFGPRGLSVDNIRFAYSLGMAGLRKFS